MTFKFKDAYINETSTVTGPYEAKGPFGKYFDLCHNDLYFSEKNWEQAEVKLVDEAINTLVNKSKINIDNVDLLIGGDLLNQIVASNYAMEKFKNSFMIELLSKDNLRFNCLKR